MRLVDSVVCQITSRLLPSPLSARAIVATMAAITLFYGRFLIKKTVTGRQSGFADPDELNQPIGHYAHASHGRAWRSSLFDRLEDR